MENGSSVKHWDSIANNYDSSRIGDHVYVACCEAVIARIGHMPASSRVLDAGCGTGLVTMMLSKHTNNICALDYSEQSLATLQSKLAKARVTAELKAGDIRALPYPDEYFDSVICANTLQHLTPGESQTRAVRELMRVLKVGGRFAFSVHHFSRHKRAAGWIKEGKPGEPGIDYIFRYTYDEVRALVKDAEGIVSCGFYDLPTFGQRVIELTIGSLLARIGVGHMLLAFGSKPPARP